MYRNTVTLDDAVAAILLMESTVNEVSSFEPEDRHYFGVKCMAENNTHDPNFYLESTPAYKDPEFSPDTFFQRDKKKVVSKYLGVEPEDNRGDRGPGYHSLCDTQLHGTDR